MNPPLNTLNETPRRHLRRAVAGLVIIGIGSLALLDNLRLFDTPLLRTFWPLALVLWGLARLFWSQHASRRLFGVLLVLAGGLMTAHNLGYGSFGLRHWWPVFIILAGAAVLLRGLFPSARRTRQRFESSAIEHSDEVNIDASFSGLKLQNDSRSFRGGKIHVNFGGVELDLREAVMAGPEATLDIHATFSGIEMRVPREWQVVVQVSATLGAVEDKTVPPANPVHRLVLRGDTTLGGIELRN